MLKTLCLSKCFKVSATGILAIFACYDFGKGRIEKARYFNRINIHSFLYFFRQESIRIKHLSSKLFSSKSLMGKGNLWFN